MGVETDTEIYKGGCRCTFVYIILISRIICFLFDLFILTLPMINNTFERDNYYQAASGIASPNQPHHLNRANSTPTSPTSPAPSNNNDDSNNNNKRNSDTPPYACCGPACRPRSMSIGSELSAHDRAHCLRHHHRSSAVAIKLMPNFVGGGGESYKTFGGSPERAVDLKSPPTPISEKILKGDFSF